MSLPGLSCKPPLALGWEIFSVLLEEWGEDRQGQFQVTVSGGASIMGCLQLEVVARPGAVLAVCLLGLVVCGGMCCAAHTAGSQLVMSLWQGWAAEHDPGAHSPAGSSDQGFVHRTFSLICQQTVKTWHWRRSWRMGLCIRCVCVCAACGSL